MNFKSDTAKFIDSLAFARGQVTDHENWLETQAQSAEEMVNDSLATLSQAEEDGDEGERAFPTLVSNLQNLLELVSQMKSKGKRNNQKIKDHLEDIAEPFENGQFRVYKAIIHKSHCSDCCN